MSYLEVLASACEDIAHALAGDLTVQYQHERWVASLKHKGLILHSGAGLTLTTALDRLHRNYTAMLARDQHNLPSAR